MMLTLFVSISFHHDRGHFLADNSAKINVIIRDYISILFASIFRREEKIESVGLVGEGLNSKTKSEM